MPDGLAGQHQADDKGGPGWLNSPRCDAASRLLRGSHPEGGQAQSSGRADQFLQDCAESARRHGEPAEGYEERAAEWNAIRPLLAVAPQFPQFLALLEEANTIWGGDCASDNPVDGGDLVESED